MITGLYYPSIATYKQLRDHFDEQVMNGKGDLPVVLDRRGLSNLVLPQYLKRDIGVCLPPDESNNTNQSTKGYLGCTF